MARRRKVTQVKSDLNPSPDGGSPGPTTNASGASGSSHKLEDLIGNWPHARAYLEQTLDGHMIERHAEALLARALNTRRVVAFVGSGVSAAYGRATWGELVRVAQDEVLARYEQIQKYQTDKHPGAPLPASMTRLKATIDSLKLERDFAADRLPMIFQVCEQLDREIVSFCARHPDFNQAKQNTKPLRWRAPDTPFRDRIKALAFDDRASALMILEEAIGQEHSEDDIEVYWSALPIGDGDRPEDKGGLKTILGLTDGPPVLERRLQRHDSPQTKDRMNANARFRTAFQCGALYGLLDRKEEKQIAPQLANHVWVAAEAAYKEKLSQIEKERRSQIEKPGDGGAELPSSWLAPTHRMLVGLAISALHPEHRLRCVRDACASVKHTRPKRSQIVDDAFDPIALLQDQLNIRRFLTTNFDLEIERLWRDRGYTLQAPSEGDAITGPNEYARSVATHPLGMVAEDLVIGSDSGANLIDFAVRDQPVGRMLAHMHGRAIDKETIVITEADYQSLYLSDGPERDVLNGAIRLAFGANPLLFVGLGMNEDDVLRPLRHFVSEVQRQPGRVAVALLPQLATPAKTAEQKVALLGRFGVHAIHYGGTRFGGGEGEEIDDNWLANTMTLLAHLSAFTKELEQSVSKDHVLEPLPILKFPKELVGWKGLKPNPGEPANDTPRPMRDPTHWSARGIPSRASVGPSLEITLLNSLIKYLRGEGGAELRDLIDAARDARGQGRDDAEAKAKNAADICKAIGRACVGLRSAIQHKMLCEALRDLSQAWSDWRSEWFETPAHRTATFPHLTQKEDQLDIEIRYHGYPPRRMRPPDREAEFYPAMADLLSALRNVGSISGLGKDGRILYIASPRGAGRGALFTGVSGRKGLNALLNAWWQPHAALGAAASEKAYCAALLYNLSFSNEIGSIFDAIAKRLWDECDKLIKAGGDDPRLPPQKKAEISAWKTAFDRQSEELANARIERLKVGVANWRKIASYYQSPSRLLIVLNGVDMLFDATGRAKNGQIELMMETLLRGSEGEGCPLDLVLMANARVAPHFFQSKERLKAQPWGPDTEPGGIALRPLFRPRSTASERANAQHALAQAGFNASEAPDHRHLVVLQRHPQVIELAQIMYSEMVVCLALSVLANQTKMLRPLPADKRRALGEAVGELNGQALLKDAPDSASLSLLLARKIMAVVAPNEEPARHEAAAFELDRLFKNLWVCTGRNRFAATLHLSVWAEQAAHRFKDMDEKCTDEFADLIRSNLKGLASKSENAGSARGDAVIAEAMHAYARLHRYDRLSPLIEGGDEDEAVFGLSGAYKDDIDPLAWLAEERQSFFEFQELILWHLAVIGQPTDVSTLAQCPEIRDYCAFLLPPDRSEQILKAASAGPGESAASGETLPIILVEDILRVALRLMTTRGLVFRVHGRTIEEIALDVATRDGDAEGKKKKTEPVTEEEKQHRAEVEAEKKEQARLVGRASRFSLHRTVQRYVLRRLNAPLSEQHERDHYVPSVYATQIDEEPRLHFDAHRRVRKLLSTLTRYPSGARLSDVERDKYVEAGCIGAAFGVVRTIYSLAIIAKFSAFEEDGRLAMPSLGFFEDHRLQMRWLLESARRVGRELEIEKGTKALRRAPLYPEEIVWLYNEVGVLSMICGQLHDALGMLRKAEEVADTLIEGASRYRPLRHRIGLNIALVDIERGRISEARARLNQIAENEQQRPVVHAIAMGYLGLCEHLSGRLDVAQTHYEKAIDRLTTKVDRSRAASIFHRHLADLRRARGDEHGARDHVGMALNLAARGGHEDVRHMARLTLARIDVTFAKPDRATSPQRELDSIEHYAKVMGMQRLLCDVSLIRAEILLRQGESRLSSDLALAALSIATICGLNLRKVDSMLALAKCYIQRGRSNAGRILLRQAADAARSFGLQRALLVAEKTFADS